MTGEKYAQLSPDQRHKLVKWLQKRWPTSFANLNTSSLAFVSDAKIRETLTKARGQYPFTVRSIRKVLFPYDSRFK